MSAFGSTADPQFAALIGDLVGSRESADRAGLQKRLEEQLQALNRRLGRGSFQAPLAFTAGDEFQALLRRPEEAVTIAVALADALHPQTISFGLGWGGLSTDPGKNVAALDGPCFHHARAALERAGRQGMWLAAEGFSESADRTLSAIFHLLGALRRGWTEKQARTVRAARTEMQKKVARRFRVSPSVVSESLAASSFEAVQAGEQAAYFLLREFGQKTEVKTNSGKRPKSDPPGRVGGRQGARARA